MSDNKMPCSKVLERIDRFLDGELEAPHRAEFESHISACSRCREELDLAERVLSEIRGLPQKECPERVVNEVFAVTERARRRPGGFPFRRLFGWRSWPLQPVAASVLLLVVIASTVLIGRLRKGTDTASPAEVARAEAEVRWTFAYVNEVGRRTGFAVRDDVLDKGVMEPMRRGVNSAFQGDNGNPQTNNGGS